MLAVLLCLAARAEAQVSVDMRALDGPGAEAPAARPAPAPTPPHHPPPRRPIMAKRPVPDVPAATGPTSPMTAASARPGPNSTVGQPPAAGPGSASQAAAPPPALPTAVPGAPPPSTMVPAPVASRAPLPPPVRLLFEDGKADLTPADEAAIRDLAHAIPTPEADSVNVVAYTAGKPDDPSTARRLSLTRGLAVRSVLLASGVPSARIYVRALGATGSEGPADRVELTVAPIGGASAPPPGTVTR